MSLPYFWCEEIYPILLLQPLEKEKLHIFISANYGNYFLSLVRDLKRQHNIICSYFAGNYKLMSILRSAKFYFHVLKFYHVFQKHDKFQIELLTGLHTI